MEIETIFDAYCRANDKIIQSEHAVASFCFIVSEKVEAIPLLFNFDKEELKNKLMQKIAKTSGLKGYILILDVKVTSYEKDGKAKVSDAVVRAMYTPEKRIRDTTFYEDRKITKKVRSEDADEEGWDSWDLWREHLNLHNPKHIGTVRKHQKFREMNPELFKDTE